MRTINRKESIESLKEEYDEWYNEQLNNGEEDIMDIYEWAAMEFETAQEARNEALIDDMLTGDR